MTESTTLPVSLARWVESVVGPVHAVRDASHARPDHEARAEAAHAVEATVAGLERHLAAVGEHLSVAEVGLLRRLVGALPFLLATGVRPENPALGPALLSGYGRPFSAVEQQALVAFCAADAASTLAHGLSRGDPEVTARGRRTVERLAEEGWR
ncbi:hypothetical protein ACH4SP_03690 [Streptomyces sp. NPDC021093]|uniref:hypothetical protein n=1 Tax=Streptomyces sp. NPDC021093 TaxID=3365112 RepID=UPI0037A0A75F